MVKKNCSCLKNIEHGQNNFEQADGIGKSYQKIILTKLLFFIKNFESPILALFDNAAKLGKASKDAYNRGGWLIL